MSYTSMRLLDLKKIIDDNVNNNMEIYVKSIYEKFQAQNLPYNTILAALNADFSEILYFRRLENHKNQQ